MRRKTVLNNNRIIRHFRIRKTLVGSSQRPRLSLYPSIKHLEAQLVDDLEGKTILGFTTKASEFQKAAGLPNGSNVVAAEKFGKFVASKAKAKGIQMVVFDRGGFLYHGRIKAFADAARAEGLTF